MEKILYFSIYLLIANNIFAQWVKVNEIPEFSNVPSFFIQENTIYAGVDSIVYISTDAGNTWSASAEIHPDVDFVSAVLYYNNRLIAGTYNYGVFVSTDQGITWSGMNTGLNGQAAKTISDLVVRDDKLYASTIGAGVFVIDLNTAGIWNSFNSGIPLSIASNVNSLVLKGADMYAGAGGNGYYYKNSSYNEGWTEYQFGMLNVEPLIFYDLASTSSGDYLISSYGIYWSSNSGVTWEPNNLGNGFISDGNFVAAGSNLFLFLTKITKTIWYKFSENDSWEFFTETTRINTLNAAYLNGKLFDGRLRGLWYYPLEPTEVEDNENNLSDFYLSNNYPNPFNPVTRIYYNVPNTAAIELIVYNNLGQEISVLVNEEKAAGKYKIEFKANGLNSGVYYYQMKVNDKIQTKKMLLIK